MEHFEVVQTWLLNSYNIKVSPDWLSACIEWIAQESEDQLQSEDTVKEQVFQQWLTSDLAEIGEPSLPAAATTCDKYKLVGNYALQIISIVDIGFPLYSQQQKLMGRENVNAEVSAERPFQPAWEPKQSRMLLITLTDGHSEIKAMELQPIRTLHSQLPSGVKCVLMGTVMCRRGMVLLTEDHIQLLGGEVDTLTEINTPLNVLQQTMDKNREDSGKHARQEFSGQFITRNSDNKPDLKDKNREDSGKHARQEFSGQFITRNSDNKPDLKRKAMFKTEGSCSKSEQRNKFQGSSQIAEKKDVKPVILSMGKVKKEEIKSEVDRDYQNNGSIVKYENEEEWGEDINYSELFDNDMEFEHQPGPSHNSFQTVQKNDNSVKISSASSRASLDNRQNHSGTIKSTGITGARISSEQSIANKEIFNISDDDMEIEDVFDESEPFWHPKVQKTLSNENSYHDSLSEKVFSSSQKSNVQIPKEKLLTKTQEISPQRINDTPQVCNQSEQIVDFNPPSPTFKSPVSNSTQASPQSEKPCLANKNQALASFMQAKKPKVQAKLSDLFSKQSKTIVKSKQEKTSKVLNSEEVFVSPSSSERHSALSSKAMNISSSAERKSSVKKPPFLPGSQTSGKSNAEILTPKTCQELRSLPKAVIQPFKPASTTEQVCNDSSTYSHLSDLQSSNTESVKVKVSILTLIKRLSSNNGSHWSLACKITDSDTTLDVDISNGVLTGLIGFSAEDSIAMRQRFKAEPEVKEIFAEGLSQCQSKLISGRGGCVLELEPACRNPIGKRPVITSFHLDSS